MRMLRLPLQTDRDVEVIRVDRTNTVKSLRDKLQQLVDSGNSDSGFPILRPDDEGLRMVGYIGANELEHALSKSSLPTFGLGGSRTSQALSRTNPTRRSSSTLLLLRATSHI